MFAKPCQCAGVALLLGLAAACSEPERTLAPIGGNPVPDSMIWWVANPELASLFTAVRDSLASFQDEAVARAAGYQPSNVCERTLSGSAGVRYDHPQLLGPVPGENPTAATDAIIDPFRPEVLLYELQEVGPPRLVGLEYVVYREAWDHANPSGPPALKGIPFDLKVEYEHDPDHYELHVWIWRYNPSGMFAPRNPRVNC